MRGEEWGRLVSAPSVTEVEAALAGVKVRAIPIARRRARNRRAGIALGIVVAGIGGVVVGRMSPAASIAASPFPPPGAATLSIVPLGHPAEVSQRWRWHLKAWSEMDGVRYDEGEAWVEGPSGTGLQFTRYDEAMSYSGGVDAMPVGHSIQINIHGQSESFSVGQGVSYTARVSGNSQAQIMPGQGVLFAPFGDKVGGKILIEGPFATAPEGTPRWQEPRSGNWDTAAAAWMAHSGIRYANSNIGPLWVRPTLRPKPGLLRFSLRGGSEGVWQSIATSPSVFMMPGLGDSLQVSGSYLRPGHIGELCLLLRSGLGNPRARQDGFGCFPNTSIRELEVSLGTRTFIRIERPSGSLPPD